MNNKLKVPLILLSIYLILFIVLAINPIDRGTWFVENFTVWIIIAVLIVLYVFKIRFSNTAYFFASILIYLHTIGGHYTFSQVPFDWITNLFGFERNHYDRMAHFTVGFYAFLVAEWLWNKKLVGNRFLLFTYPVFLIATVAMVYEIIEWVFAISVNPEAGAAFLGSQGDIWDAQKDMLLDTLGAVFIMIIFFLIRKPKFKVRSKNQ
jgi:putative membrane protein